MTGPSIVLPGLPTFNADDRDFRITGFDGWWATAKPRAELVISPSDGAIAVGPWDFAEAYYTLSGDIRASDRATLMERRRLLLAALPADETTTLIVLGNDEDIDLQVDVRRYDAPDIDVVGNNLLFTMPLVAVDPFKYGADALSGSMVAFNGSVWYLPGNIDTAPAPDEFYFASAIDTAPNPDEFYFAMTQDTEAAAQQAAVLNSPGDATSRRLTFTVTGPLDAGDWLLVHEQTGRHLYASLAVTAGSSITFDCYEQRAYIDGNPIDRYVFGDYLTLDPGDNTYRLVVGSDSAGTATVEGRPAFQ